MMVRVGNLTIPMECFVVENVTKILIGMDWLSRNVELMDLKYRYVIISGQTIPLRKPPANRVMRRIQAKEVVRVPPKFEVNVVGQVMFGDLANYDDN